MDGQKKTKPLWAALIAVLTVFYLCMYGIKALHEKMDFRAFSVKGKAHARSFISGIRTFTAKLLNKLQETDRKAFRFPERKPFRYKKFKLKAVLTTAVVFITVFSMFAGVVSASENNVTAVTTETAAATENDTNASKNDASATENTANATGNDTSDTQDPGFTVEAYLEEEDPGITVEEDFVSDEETAGTDTDTSESTDGTEDTEDTENSDIPDGTEKTSEADGTDETADGADSDTDDTENKADSSGQSDDETDTDTKEDGTGKEDTASDIEDTDSDNESEDSDKISDEDSASDVDTDSEKDTDSEEDTDSDENTDSDEDADSDKDTDSDEDLDSDEDADPDEYSADEKSSDKDKSSTDSKKKTSKEKTSKDKDPYGISDEELSKYDGIDFSSKKLLVKCSANILIKENVSITENGGLYLIQFADEDTCKKAYAYYKKNAALVIPDGQALTVCTENETASAAEEKTSATEEKKTGITESTEATEDKSGTGTDKTKTSEKTDEAKTTDADETAKDAETEDKSSEAETSSESGDGQYSEKADDADDADKTDDSDESDEDSSKSEESITVTADNAFAEANNCLAENGTGAYYDIALIDSGAEGPNVIKSVSVLSDDSAGSHGTAMAAYIAEESPSSTVLSIKAFTEDGKADISAVYAAFEYAMSQNVRIINLSASGLLTEDNAILKDIINEAVSKGIWVVGAAGNNDSDASYFIPGCIEGAYITGACDETGSKISVSNYGSTVDYYVNAGSTSEAAARLSGLLSYYGTSGINEILNAGKVFEPGYVPEEKEEETEENPEGEAYVLENENGELNLAAMSGSFTGVTEYCEDNKGVIFTGTITINSSHTIKTAAYCVDYKLDTPTGIPYVYNGDSIAKRSAKWRNAVTYAMLNGYRLDSTGWMTRFGLSNDAFGRSLAQLITQCAIHEIAYYAAKEAQAAGEDYSVYNTLLGEAGDPGYPEFIYLHMRNNYLGKQYETHNNQYANLAIALAKEAWANASSAADNVYTSIWKPTTKTASGNTAQRLLTIGATGTLTVKKNVPSKTGSLTISKTTKGTSAALSQAFTFTLVVKNSSGTVLAGPYSYTNQSGGTGSISGNSGTVSLKSGQWIKVTGLPAGSTWTVTETAVSGYTVTTPSTRTATGSFPSLTDKFPIKVVITPSDGSSTISETIYLAGGASKTYTDIPGYSTYTVQETAVANYTCDISQKAGTIDPKEAETVTITNTDARASSTWNQTAAFTNYQDGSLTVSKSVPTVTGKLHIGKTVSGSATDLTVKTFSFLFNLKNSSGTAITTSYSYTKSDGTKGTIKNGDTISLKHNEYIDITGLPAESTWMVTETGDTYFTTTPTTYVKTGTFPALDTAFSIAVTIKKPSGTTQSETLSLKSGASKTYSGLPYGTTWTVQETAKSGYVCDTTKYSGTIGAGETVTKTITNKDDRAAQWSQTAAFTNTRKPSTLKITKTTSSQTVTDQLVGNANYAQNFEGAQFKVVITDRNDSTKTSTQTVTTDDTGSFTVTGLYAGDKYSVTEIKSPKGYLIDTSTAKTGTLAAGTNTVNFSDTPTFDLTGVIIEKEEYVNGKFVESKKLKGAVFKVEYFTSFDCTGTATRTWYFETDSNGKWQYDSEWLATGYTSDELYKNKEGFYDLPIGSVKVQEVAAPKGYQILKGYITGTITQPSEGAEAYFSWNTASFPKEVKWDATLSKITYGDYESVILIQKIDKATKKPLAGATIQVIDVTDGTEKVIATFTSTTTPYKVEKLLEVSHNYKIRETAAPEGYLPLDTDISFSTSETGEIINIKPDTVEHETTTEGYVLIYMDNTKKITIPVAGSDSFTKALLLGLVIISASGTAFVFSRRRKTSRTR